MYKQKRLKLAYKFAYNFLGAFLKIIPIIF
jgi:hypothetical protein